MNCKCLQMKFAGARQESGVPAGAGVVRWRLGVVEDSVDARFSLAVMGSLGVFVISVQQRINPSVQMTLCQQL